MKKAGVKVPNEYIIKIMELYPMMSYDTIVAQRYHYKTTYRKLYYDYLDRLNTLNEGRLILQWYSAKDLKGFKVFKGKHQSTISQFLKSVMKEKDCVPMKRFIDRLKKLLIEIDEAEKQKLKDLEDDEEEL